jgi:hypothetical protein
METRSVSRTQIGLTNRRRQAIEAIGKTDDALYIEGVPVNRYPILRLLFFHALEQGGRHFFDFGG